MRRLHSLRNRHLDVLNPSIIRIRRIYLLLLYGVVIGRVASVHTRNLKLRLSGLMKTN